MWEKPIHCYVFINGPQYEVSIYLTDKHKDGGEDKITYKMVDPSGGWPYGLSATASNFSRTTKGPWANDRMVLDSSNVNGLFETVGKLRLSVKANGMECCSEWQKVDSYWGGLGNGTMKDVGFQKTTFFEDHAVQFTLYDAGPGLAGLPKAHQLNVTVAPKRSDWMSGVAPVGSTQAQKPFRSFVIPCAHDCGIFTMDTVRKMCGLSMNGWLAVEQGILSLAPPWLLPLRAVSPEMILQTVEALSRTQKDDIKTQLALGARYFEFRASRVHPCPIWLSDELYFHHNFIPGVALKTFFHDIVEFLGDHTGEFVVIRLEFNHYSEKHPEQAEVLRLLDAEIAASVSKGKPLKRIGFPTKDKKIADLRSNNERLIFFFNSDPDAQPFDLYDSNNHADLQGDKIIQEFESITVDAQKAGNTQFTIFQCQGTASENKDVIANAVITRNKCLLATKAICDAKTLPWLMTKALDRLADDHLGIIMNDFFDLSTSDVANELSKLRLAGQTSAFNFWPYSGQPQPKLSVIAAYWADADVKSSMSKFITADSTTLTMNTGNLGIKDPWPNVKKTLNILYSYTSSSDLFVLITTENNGIVSITPTAGTESPAVGINRVGNTERVAGKKFYLVGAVYGFQLVSKQTVKDKIQQAAEGGTPINVSDGFFESDGNLVGTKTCYIYYRTELDGPIKSTLGKQGSSINLTL